MGFFSSIGKMFGFKKKSRKDVGGEPFQGPRPPASLKETPEGQLFIETLKERLAGRGVGFRPEILSGATAPFAQAQRAGLREFTIPEISAQASARGLGRSTIPVSRIGLESSRVERNIAERIADLQLRDEQQRRAEINQALSGLGGVAGAEAGLRTARSSFELQEHLRNQTANAAIAGAQETGIGRLITVGASLALAAVNPAAGALSMASAFSGGDTSDLLSAYTLLGGNIGDNVGGVVPITDERDFRRTTSQFGPIGRGTARGSALAFSPQRGEFGGILPRQRPILNRFLGQ